MGKTSKGVFIKRSIGSQKIKPITDMGMELKSIAV
jgi:hypothetical protein